VQASLPLADDASTVAPYVAVEALPIGADPLAADGADTLTGDAATLAGLTSLESQFAFVASLLEAEEGAYNTANPSTPENRATIAPDYNNRRLAVSAVMPLSGGGLSALTGTYLP
jgi:hypothetical protein